MLSYHMQHQTTPQRLIQLLANVTARFYPKTKVKLGVLTKVLLIELWVALLSTGADTIREVLL